MTFSDMLIMLKSNLEISNSLRDTYLTQLIQVAVAAIESEGVVFDSEDGYTVFDANLIVMYASYLYRKRAGDESDTQYTTAAFGASGMPRMLRYALNNRLMEQKMAGDA